MHDILSHCYMSYLFNYFLGCYKKSECNILQYSSDDQQVASCTYSQTPEMRSTVQPYQRAGGLCDKTAIPS